MGPEPAGPGAAAASPAPRGLVLFALAVAIVGWGWAWVGIRYCVQFVPPGALALGRYLVASLALGVFWTARGARRPQPRDYPGLLLMGLLGFTIYNVAINSAERTVPAGLASMIAATIPVLTTLAAVLTIGERLSRLAWIGVGLAFAGVAYLGLSQSISSGSPVGVLLLLLGVVATVGYNLLNKRFLGLYRPLDVTTWSIWAGTVGLLPWTSELLRAAPSVPRSAWWTLLGLALVPGVLSYTLYAWVLARLPLARVSSSTFLVPVVAMLLSYWLLSEPLSGPELAASAVILAGVWLVVRR